MDIELDLSTIELKMKLKKIRQSGVSVGKIIERAIEDYILPHNNRITFPSPMGRVREGVGTLTTQPLCHLTTNYS